MMRRIVCAGDSFTAGVELCADELIPNYTQNLLGNLDEIPKDMEDLNNKFVSKITKMPKQDRLAYWEKERNLAWPSYMKSAKNRVYNVSSGGISNQEICHRAISKLEEIGRKPKEKLYAFVMLTSPERYGHPTSDTINPYGYPFKQLYSQTLAKGKGPDYDVTEYWYTHHDSIDLYWHSYNAIHGLINYCRYMRVQLTLFDSCLWNWGYQNILKWKKDDPRLSLVQNLRGTIPTTYTMSDFAGPKTKLPGGHFCLDVHKKFGKAASDLL